MVIGISKFLENKKLLIVALSIVVMTIVSSPSVLLAGAASTNDTMLAKIGCRAIKLMTNEVVVIIGTIALFALGIGAFLGKVSMMVFLTTAAGLALAYGAPGIIDYIANEGNTSGDTSATTLTGECS